MGQQGFGRDTTFDNVGRCRRLDDTILALEGIDRPVGDQDAELCPHDIETFARFHTDQDLGLAFVLRQNVRLNGLFDPFQMSREDLARTRRALGRVALGGSLFNQGFQFGDACRDVIEQLRLLLIRQDKAAQLLRFATEARATKDLEDRGQIFDAFFGIGVDPRQVLDARLGIRVSGL